MTFRCELLVEGVDDAEVIKHMIGDRDQVAQIDFGAAKKGFESVLRSYPVRLRANVSRSVAVVVDGDNAPLEKWARFRGILEREGYVGVPESPSAAGLILEPPSELALPRTGVWIMPDNSAPGALEDFLKFLIPDDSQLFQMAASAVARIPPEHRRFSSQSVPKAELYTWLAWQEVPGRPYGTAIHNRYFHRESSKAAPFLEWLTRILE